MKLGKQDYKRFLELQSLIKANKATEEQKAEFAKLEAMRNNKGSNDLAWWNNYPELLKGVTNLPFNFIPGTDVYIQNDTGTDDELQLANTAIAMMAPGIGFSTQSADAFNSQIRQLWLDMHRKYRGIGTYQRADLGMAIIAINSFFETIAKFERIYGVINSYHIGNRVVPYGLKNALGISSNLETNLADFRYLLNLYIEKGRQLCLPKGLSVLASDVVAVSNLFKDSKDRRAFIFGFDTRYYGIYDATSVATGGCVKFKAFEVGEMNGVTDDGFNAFLLSDVVSVLETQLGALINDDDIAKMCSDLLAAYGPENVMTLVSLPENYKVEPVEDYERSLQWHNLTIAGECSSIYETSVIDATAAAAFDTAGCPIVIYQHDDVVKCRLGKGQGAHTTSGGFVYPTYTANGVMGKVGNVIFDTWVETPGEAEIMCGSRYTCTVDVPVLVSSNTFRSEVSTFGTKVVEYVYMFSYRAHSYYAYKFMGSSVTSTVLNSNYEQFIRIAQCDWHPTFYISDSGDVDVYGDLDNFTVLSAANLKRIHEVALLSGYKIPLVSQS